MFECLKLLLSFNSLNNCSIISIRNLFSRFWFSVRNTGRNLVIVTEDQSRNNRVGVYSFIKMNWSSLELLPDFWKPFILDKGILSIEPVSMSGVFAKFLQIKVIKTRHYNLSYFGQRIPSFDIFPHNL